MSVSPHLCYPGFIDLLGYSEISFIPILFTLIFLDSKVEVTTPTKVNSPSIGQKNWSVVRQQNRTETQNCGQTHFSLEMSLPIWGDSVLSVFCNWQSLFPSVFCPWGEQLENMQRQQVLVKRVK